MIEIRGRSYRPRSFEELTGSDWKRLMKAVEGACDPSAFYASVQRLLTVLMPLTARDMKNLTDDEILTVGGAALHHIADVLQEFDGVMGRFERGMAMMVKNVEAIQVVAGKTERN